jgi:hypothetical protein
VLELEPTEVVSAPRTPRPSSNRQADFPHPTVRGRSPFGYREGTANGKWPQAKLSVEARVGEEP